MDIKDKIIIVTGASEGIGEATARVLSRQGAQVVLAARSGEKLGEIAEELHDALAVATDMRLLEDVRNLVRQTVRKYGRIDALINNAGQGLYGPIEHIDLAQFRDVLELNVFGVLRAMQEVIPIMREQGGGSILNVSSRVSKHYFPYLGAYAATKYALNCISLTARKELEKDSIVVSVFYPRMTATNFFQHALGQSLDSAQRRSNGTLAPEVDTAEQVAEQIVKQLRTGEAERAM